MLKVSTSGRAPKGARVAVLGASPNPERMSHLAVIRLREHGFEPIPVHPNAKSIAGIVVRKDIAGLQKPIDTLTVYVNSSISSALRNEILSLLPRRVIFNPGGENESLAQELRSADIEVVHGCTLVMLNAAQF